MPLPSIAVAGAVSMPRKCLPVIYGPNGIGEEVTLNSLTRYGIHWVPDLILELQRRLERSRAQNRAALFACSDRKKFGHAVEADYVSLWSSKSRLRSSCSCSAVRCSAAIPRSRLRMYSIANAFTRGRGSSSHGFTPSFFLRRASTIPNSPTTPSVLFREISTFASL